MRGFFNSQFFTYIFVYFQVYYIFYILKVTILLLSFSYVLYFEFPIFPTSSYRLSVSKMFYLPVCIAEPANVFQILVMLLKD